MFICFFTEQKKLQNLLGKVEVLLNSNDYNNANEAICHGEYGIAFDIIVTQLYQYDVTITQSIFDLIEECGEILKLRKQEWDFMKSQISIESPPEPVSEGTAKIIVESIRKKASED